MMNMRNLTMEDAATMAGPLPRVRHCRKCAKCGGGLAWAVEITNARPWGTGYDILVCEECNAEADRHWVGF